MLFVFSCVSIAVAAYILFADSWVFLSSWVRTSMFSYVYFLGKAPNRVFVSVFVVFFLPNRKYVGVLALYLFMQQYIL